MNESATRRYRQLVATTLWALAATLVFAGCSWLAQHLGYEDAVAGLEPSARAMAFIFGVLLSLLVVVTAVTACVDRLTRSSTTRW